MNISIKNLTKKWGDFTAVNNVSLEIEDNAFVTLLGPSGCGKTTILRMIAGLEVPTEGHIEIGGKVMFDSESGEFVPPNKRNVGFLFQNYALWPNMTVYKNIAFGLENKKLPKDEIEETVERVCSLVKINELKDRYPSELSGGQQQRVAIARTLAPNPNVLFMDEPLSNLDAKLRIEMRSELQRLHHTLGTTFVYVTHDQLEAMTLATKICLMNKGEVQMYDKPLTVYNRPLNLFTADFVGSPSINIIEKDDGYYAVRPEDVIISENAPYKGEVYAVLPTGSETIVKIKVKDKIITSVIFGNFSKEMSDEVSFSFNDNSMMLFDKGTKELIKKGTFQII